MGAKPPPGSIARLKNLGPASSEWLAEIGVRTPAQLRAIGSLEAYRLIRARGRPASLNLVYAIQAALMDIHWQRLPPDIRDDLKVQVRLLEMDGMRYPAGD